MKTTEFKNKVVVITGSSQGIGKTTAIQLSNLGAKIVLNGRDKNKLYEVETYIKNLGGHATSYCCDITCPDNAKRLIKHAIKHFGSLDILINNAGVSMRGNFSELKPEVFETVFNINVHGAVNTSLYAIPYIRKSKGSIVFISSVAGIHGLPNNSAYSSSKMALRAIAESIRIEEAQSNIHVGLIYAGITQIEKGKKTIAADGSLISVRNRSSANAQSMQLVANAIIKNIKQRKFRTTLSFLGKLNAFLQSLAPDLVEYVLINSSRKVALKSI